MDEQAFQTFYRETAGPLRAYVVRVLGATQAADVVQETILRLLRMPSAPDDPRQLRMIAFRIASNLMNDHWRGARREQNAAQAQPAETGHSGPDLPLRLDMKRMFAQLSPQHRQLLWLAHVEGADHREIAAAVGVREGSVRVLLHRARRKLAQLLREGGAGVR
jgi:RNA polymerase sigma-70 factor, ECF subfamily